MPSKPSLALAREYSACDEDRLLAALLTRQKDGLQNCPDERRLPLLGRSLTVLPSAQPGEQSDRLEFLCKTPPLVEIFGAHGKRFKSFDMEHRDLLLITPGLTLLSFACQCRALMEVIPACKKFDGPGR
jgi:hypothetical protein